MSHPREEWLALEATGDLSWWRAALVRRHVAACADCAARVQEYSGLSTELRGLPAIEPPLGLSAQVLAAVSMNQDSAVPRPRLVPAWMALSAVAALALLVVVGVVGVELRAPIQSPVVVRTRPTAPEVTAQPTIETARVPEPSVRPVVFTDLNQAEAARDRAYLKTLAARQPASIASTLERWTETADQQQRVQLRPLAGPRAELLRSHALPGRVEIVKLPGAPLEIVAARASFSEGRLLDPTVEVRNTGARPVKDFQIVWTFRDAAGGEYRARIAAARRAVAPGERTSLAETLAFETGRTGPEAEIVGVRVFLRSAEFTDAQVWVPERKALEARGVGQFLPLSQESQRLWAAIRRSGVQALLTEFPQK
jgi:hypothetical protein